MKIIIGCSTYGTLPRVNGFIRSYWGNLEITKHELTNVVIDDGTPDIVAVREREQFCRQRSFNFVRNEQNLGIPATWNKIASFIPDADLAIIFNDNISFLAPGWLTRVVYFFENNEKIGVIGFPILHETGFHSDDPRWDNLPERIEGEIRDVFVIRPSILFSIENIDGNRGFSNDLISHNEECQISFQLAEMGYVSYQLPWPPFCHFEDSQDQSIKIEPHMDMQKKIITPQPSRFIKWLDRAGKPQEAMS